MLLLSLFEVLLIVLGIAFVVVQVLIPLITRTTLFPMFRRERSVALKQIQEVKAQLDDTDLKNTLQSLQDELKAKQEPKQKSEPQSGV